MATNAHFTDDDELEEIPLGDDDDFLNLETSGLHSTLAPNSESSLDTVDGVFSRGNNVTNKDSECKELITDFHVLDIGTYILIKYYGFWHAALLTGVFPARNKIRAVHYAFPVTGVTKIFAKRTVLEEEFPIDITRKELWKVRIPDSKRCGPEEALVRAFQRLGETKFNTLNRRSSHLVRECLTKHK